MKEKLIIVGTSTAAETLYEFVKYYDLFDVKGFVVDEKYKNKDEFNGLPVYSFEELNKIYKKEEIFIFVAIFWNKLNRDKKEMFIRLKKEGYSFANVIAPNSIIRGKIIGENCWISDYCIIDTGAIINDGVFVRAQSFIAHYVNVESFVYCGAKCMIGGRVKIGEQSFIGLNATIFDEVNIGKKCIIGAGTAIKRNVPDNTVCKLSNDNIIQKTYSEDIIEEKLMFTKNVR